MMYDVSAYPARLFFDAIVAPERQREDGTYLYPVIPAEDSGRCCFLMSKTPRTDTHIRVLLGAISAMNGDCISKFTPDDLFACWHIIPNFTLRYKLAKTVENCLKWFMDCTCHSKELNTDKKMQSYHFQVVNGWTRKPDSYEFAVQWNADFITYLKEAYAKMTLPSHLGSFGGLRPTPLRNALVYSIEKRASDSSKKKNSDIFRLETYLVERWGVKPPDKDPEHFSRSLKKVDSNLREDYANVDWHIGKTKITVSDVSPKNWKEVSIHVSGGKWK